VRQITHLVNPITRTEVRLDPPYVCRFTTDPEARQEYDDLIKRFSAWCAALWELGRMDPNYLPCVDGWRRWDT
jgi:hypothetical protein